VKYVAEMGSGAMIQIPCFMKIGLQIRKLIRIDSQSHRRPGDRISPFSFF
jgi:hypothetical protein